VSYPSPFGDTSLEVQSILSASPLYENIWERASDLLSLCLLRLYLLSGLLPCTQMRKINPDWLTFSSYSSWLMKRTQWSVFTRESYCFETFAALIRWDDGKRAFLSPVPFLIPLFRLVLFWSSRCNLSNVFSLLPFPSSTQVEFIRMDRDTQETYIHTPIEKWVWPVFIYFTPYLSTPETQVISHMIDIRVNTMWKWNERWWYFVLCVFFIPLK